MDIYSSGDAEFEGCNRRLKLAYEATTDETKIVYEIVRTGAKIVSINFLQRAAKVVASPLIKGEKSSSPQFLPPISERINEVNVQQINDAQQVSAAQEDPEDSLGAAAVATHLVSIVADNLMIGTEKSISIRLSSMAATSSMVERWRESPMTAGKLLKITPLEQNPVDVQSTPKMCGISSQTDSISNLQGRSGLNPKLTPSFPSSSAEQGEQTPVISAPIVHKTLQNSSEAKTTSNYSSIRLFSLK
ncbi:OLC1v1013348C1 [Oldenlandia corymbosa var. corymbosa]|uniref:OLC1v1013348C1 n=1 Tax=Oldenlandia corymbosa var. corymbosa TaxID=529605 RepID=A0AAV1DY35_OLDCO|nr:OLC1v1013348C1 [Oldenlandia corymbosa var. corymbosa]